MDLIDVVGFMCVLGLTNDFAGDFQELASRWLMGNGLSAME
jgi:hypothetical protein